MRPFNKTTATFVRHHPFSTLCPTPIGNSPVWTDGFKDVTTPSAAIIQQQTKPCTSMVQCACGSCSDDIMIRSGHGDWVREKNQRVKEMLNKS